MPTTRVADLKPGQTFLITTGSNINSSPRPVKVRTARRQNYINCGTQEITAKVQINFGYGHGFVLDANETVELVTK